MAAPLRTRVRMIEIKVEATKGTAETATLLDLMAYDLTINPTVNFIERKGSGKKLGHTNSGIVDGLRTGECSFTAELRLDGSANVIDSIEAALQGCGLKLTTKTYTPESDYSDQKTVTILVYEDGLKKSLVGAMGNVEMYADSGGRVLLDFSFQGRWISPVDGTIPASPSYEITGVGAPVKFQGANATFTIEGTARKISNFRFATNNEIYMRPNGPAAGGIDAAIITDRDPTLTIDPEADLVANVNYYNEWLTGLDWSGKWPVVIVVSDGTDYATLTIPNWQIRDIAEGERDKIQSEDITGICVTDDQTAGDDEFSLVIAAHI